MYRVLALHKKFYNKWMMITRVNHTPSEVYWNKGCKKGQVHIDARRIEVDKKSPGQFVDIDPMKVPVEERKYVTRAIDMSDIINVHGSITKITL